MTVKFTKPDELFNKEMGTSAGGIVEKAYVREGRRGQVRLGHERDGQRAVQADELEVGQRDRARGQPGYWDPNLQPKVQKVTLKFITDTSTITSALLSGEIDGAYEVPPTSIPALKSAPNGKLYFGPSLSVSEIAISNPKGPMGNPQLRKALSMAIDRPGHRREGLQRRGRRQQDPHAADGLGPRGDRRLQAGVRRAARPDSPTSTAPSRSSPARRAPTSRW